MIALRNSRVAIAFGVTVLGVIGSAKLAWADNQQVVFTIDPTQSTFQYSTVGGTYGTYVPVSPGSDTTSVSGHFVVDFNPLTDTPTSIQFIGGDGYYQQDGPMTVKSQAPGLTVNYTGLSWDFDSPVLSGTGGVYAANTTHFTVLAGGLTETYTNNTSQNFPATPYDGLVTAGQWTLSETGGPGSGNWTLGVSGHYTEPAGEGPAGSTGTFTLNAVSTAHFGSSNVATVAPTATQVSALGGSSTPGGVTMDLSGATNGGTFTVQQLPNSGRCHSRRSRRPRRIRCSRCRRIRWRPTRRFGPPNTPACRRGKPRRWCSITIRRCCRPEPISRSWESGTSTRRPTPGISAAPSTRRTTRLRSSRAAFLRSNWGRPCLNLRRL